MRGLPDHETIVGRPRTDKERARARSARRDGCAEQHEGRIPAVPRIAGIGDRHQETPQVSDIACGEGIGRGAHLLHRAKDGRWAGTVSLGSHGSRQPHEAGEPDQSQSRNVPGESTAMPPITTRITMDDQPRNRRTSPGRRGVRRPPRRIARRLTPDDRGRSGPGGSSWSGSHRVPGHDAGRPVKRAVQLSRAAPPRWWAVTMCEPGLGEGLVDGA